MIYLKENPIGIDLPLQRLQTALYNGLVQRWGILEADYNCFGRVYRNQESDRGYFPEAFIEGRDYEDPLTNDRIAATSFFGESSRTNIVGYQAETDVHLIFCIDLSKVKPNITHRPDEECHMDILSILNKNSVFATVESTELWNDFIFREYNAWRSQDGMKFSDMHPYHCFRVNMKMTYKNYNC